MRGSITGNVSGHRQRKSLVKPKTDRSGFRFKLLSAKTTPVMAVPPFWERVSNAVFRLHAGLHYRKRFGTKAAEVIGKPCRNDIEFRIRSISYRTVPVMVVFSDIKLPESRPPFLAGGGEEKINRQAVRVYEKMCFHVLTAT